MAKAIFISIKDIKRYSVIDGNVDPDKIIQFAEVAQDIHIQRYLGTDLYEKFQTLITGGTLDDVANADYKSLLVDYIKPMHVYWALVEYLPNAAYTIAKGGVYKHQSETSVSVDKEEIDSLKAHNRNIADFYTNRFIDYMCYNSATFPEYNTNSNGDIYPDKKSNFSGWVL